MKKLKSIDQFKTEEKMLNQMVNVKGGDWGNETHSCERTVDCSSSTGTPDHICTSDGSVAAGAGKGLSTFG